MEHKVTKDESVDLIIQYESGTISTTDLFRLFGYLIRTGLAWQLQGSIYGRPATDMISYGYIQETGEVNWKKVEEEND